MTKRPDLSELNNMEKARLNPNPPRIGAVPGKPQAPKGQARPPKPDHPPGISGSRNNDGSSKAALERWERDYQCVQLRRAEVDFITIAETLGYASSGHAHDRFTAFMRQYPRDDVEQMRDLELDRIEKTARALEPTIAAGGQNAVRAAEVWNKLSERRSKLMGLDKPERKEVTVVTEDAVDKAIREAQQEMERKRSQALEAGIEMPTIIEHGPIEPAELAAASNDVRKTGRRR